MGCALIGGNLWSREKFKISVLPGKLFRSGGTGKDMV